MNIPFSPPYIDPETEKEVLVSLRSGWITSGPKVRELEKLLQQNYNIPNVVTCNSGTSSLELVLHWFGVGHGDEVIIPAYTYAATALAVLHAGATPVMVDCTSDFNLDVKKVQEAITERTKVIIPVDIGGWPADYVAFHNLLKDLKFQPGNEYQKKLGRPLLLADAAHSIGAGYDGKKSGNFADISIFSFHAVKNITTAEGGAICLNLPKLFDNSQVAKTLKLWTLNGQTKDAFTKSKVGGWKYDIIYPGFKMNMPDVLAAIGLAQLRIYEAELLPKRREIFKRYNKFFADYSWAQTPFYESESKKSSAHLYMLRIRDITELQRDRIIELIASKGVAVNVHFIPLPMLSIFKTSGYTIKDYPVAYDNYAREISLPIYPQLTDKQVEYIIESVVKCVEEILNIKAGGSPPLGGREVSAGNSTAPPRSPKGAVIPQGLIKGERRVAPLGGGTQAEESQMHYGASNQLFSFSRELRDRETQAEKLLWSHLRKSQLGVKFRRQHPIGNYIADFYCHPARLVIELDGKYHNSPEQKTADTNRDKTLNELGISVLRFNNNQVFDNIDEVIIKIKNELATRQKM